MKKICSDERRNIFTTQKNEPASSSYSFHNKLASVTKNGPSITPIEFSYPVKLKDSTPVSNDDSLSEQEIFKLFESIPQGVSHHLISQEQPALQVLQSQPTENKATEDVDSKYLVAQQQIVQLNTEAESKAQLIRSLQNELELISGEKLNLRLELASLQEELNHKNFVIKSLEEKLQDFAVERILGTIGDSSLIISPVSTPTIPLCSPNPPSVEVPLPHPPQGNNLERLRYLEKMMVATFTEIENLRNDLNLSPELN